jgi:alpha-amylase
MPSVCLYFQIHQPFRLRKYTAFDSDPHYFDNVLNAQLVRRIAERCYLPMNRLLLESIRSHGGRLKLALSVTGTALEQFEAYAPEVLHGLHALAETRCVEFLGETYYHSLASLQGPGGGGAAGGVSAETGSARVADEFHEQVEMHRRMIKRLFGQTPGTFRNTELIYSNAIAARVAGLGFRGMLAEGWEPVLNNRSTAFLYRAMPTPARVVPGGGGETAVPPPVLLLLRNHHLSDAIAFRFSDVRSPDFPVTDEKFAQQVSQIGGRLCNLFMDYETFGEHQSAATGIFEFMGTLPGKLLAHNCDFVLPGELLAAADAPREGAGRGDAEVETAGELDVPEPISWADEARDLGAWMGNAMQNNAFQELYALEPAVKGSNDPRLLAEWRKLTTSDHLYYMSTKGEADGNVHSYFRPYDSPYDAYINFMNVLDHLRGRVR